MNIVVLLEYESYSYAACCVKKVKCVVEICYCTELMKGKIATLCRCKQGIISLVVKYLPSKQMSWVRFPDDAIFASLAPTQR